MQRLPPGAAKTRLPTSVVRRAFGQSNNEHQVRQVNLGQGHDRAASPRRDAYIGRACPIGDAPTALLMAFLHVIIDLPVACWNDFVACVVCVLRMANVCLLCVHADVYAPYRMIEQQLLPCVCQPSLWMPWACAIEASVMGAHGPTSDVSFNSLWSAQ